MGNLTNLQATTLASEYDFTKVAPLNALLQILDDTIAGKIDVAVTTADVTLTGTPAAPQAQHLFINASGALTGNRAITVPVNATGIGKARLYIVKNGTSGAYILTFKLAGGTGTAITQGYTAICFFDGSDIVKLFEVLSAGVNTAWTAFTPTVTATTGTITTVGAHAGRYMQIGKTVMVELDITITTNGTGAVVLRSTLPFTSSAFPFELAGGEVVNTGKSVRGRISASVAYVDIVFYDSTYPAADGSRIVLTGTFETA